MNVSEQFWTDTPELVSMRIGFGEGLKQAGEQYEKVVALSADLTESTQLTVFKETFPKRFIQVGVAEQNMMTVASGLARAGKLPFAVSYAAFNPGRNWEQIRTTICLNDMPVKIIGSHAGISVGPDGATHQALEDIALMRVLPNMAVIAPGDAIEARKATLALAVYEKPAYMRLCRDKTPVFTTEDAPFEIGKAYVLREGGDITLLGTGSMTHRLLKVAANLEYQGVSAEVIHIPTIKPLDNEEILRSVRTTGRVVSVEEAQISGGFGGAIAELLAEKLPTPLLRLGISDAFGESGTPEELIQAFRLDIPSLTSTIKEHVDNTPKYHNMF